VVEQLEAAEPLLADARGQAVGRQKSRVQSEAPLIVGAAGIMRAQALRRIRARGARPVRVFRAAELDHLEEDTTARNPHESGLRSPEPAPSRRIQPGKACKQNRTWA
jgi:hypothetical protein